jgi:nucleoside-diphosphate-sugar epimerase
VTGAAGFIGRWVVDELLKCGYTVHGLDDLSNGSRRNIDDFDSHERFDLTVGDIAEDGVVSDLLNEETEACIHLAAEIDV